MKIHLVQEPIQKPTERRPTAFNINYLTTETYLDQRFKERSSSPHALQLLRSRQSLDSSASDGNLIHRLPLPLPQQQKLVQPVRNEVKYYIQRITNV